jgi:hypothetical protein
VIKDFGEVRPFSNIREAEARHIEALHRLLTAYALPIPDNPWPGRVERYASVREACEAGVAAEIENGQLYDRLLARRHGDRSASSWNRRYRGARGRAGLRVRPA